MHEVCTIPEALQVYRYTCMYMYVYVKVPHPHTCTDIHEMCVPSFNSFDEVMKSGELCTGSPDPQSRHVGHVSRLWGSGGTAVHNPGLGKLLLQLEYSQSCLARLAGTSGHKVFGFVAFIKHNLRVVLVKALHYVGLQMTKVSRERRLPTLPHIYSTSQLLVGAQETTFRNLSTDISTVWCGGWLMTVDWWGFAWDRVLYRSFGVGWVEVCGAPAQRYAWKKNIFGDQTS